MNGPWCAHQKVVRKDNNKGGLVTREWWECSGGCGMTFAPAVTPPKPVEAHTWRERAETAEAKVESLEQQLNEAKKALELCIVGGGIVGANLLEKLVQSFMEAARNAAQEAK